MIWLITYSLLISFRATGDAYTHLDRKTLGKRYLAATGVIT